MADPVRVSPQPPKGELINSIFSNLKTCPTQTPPLGAGGLLLMQTQLFPPEIIENTTEAYLPEVTVRSQLIYVSVLLLLVGTLAALPFIYVDVSVQSPGIIRTVSEKNELKSLVSGTLAEVKVIENQAVRQGQVLFTLTADATDSKRRLNESLFAEKQAFIRDLEKLTSLQNSILGKPETSTPLYTQQCNEFRFVRLEKQNQLEKARIDLVRYRTLFDQKVIAAAEFEEKQFAHRKIASEYQTLIETQRSRWQADLNRYRLEVNQLEAEGKQLSQEKELYTIKAPVSGTVQQLTGKYAGSFVQLGESLGIVSPDSNLVVEAYVTPQDIGLLQKGMKANFQVDAFNYNEWGLVSGQVTDIAGDFMLMENKPVFKVKCRLDKQTLQLKNGYTARLKKGMTLRTRFVVTRRSLFQLLYDKADDWLNPTLSD